MRVGLQIDGLLALGAQDPEHTPRLALREGFPVPWGLGGKKNIITKKAEEKCNKHPGAHN